MKSAVVLLWLLQVCSSFDLPRTGCQSDITINDDHYNKTDTYKVGDAYPTDAHYDYQGNLFFVESGRNSNGFYFNVKVINAQKSTPRTVNGLPDGISYSIAMAQKEKNVYFGTGRGLYQYDYETERALLISESSMKMNMVFVDKDGNKYVSETNNGVEEIYLLDGDKKIRFHTLEALNELGIDDKNNFYFIKEEKLFVLKNTLSTPVLIGNVSYDGLAQISFHKESVFVASENLLHFRENDSEKLIKIENVPGKVTAIAFDVNDNFVLGDQGKLLKYKKNACYLRRNNN